MRISNYNVLDLTLNQYIGKNLTCEEVSKLIGVNVKLVSKYPREEILYKKRYLIENNEIVKIFDTEVLDEWDRYRLELNPNAKRM